MWSNHICKVELGKSDVRDLYPWIVVAAFEACYGSPATSSDGLGCGKGVSNHSEVPELGACHVEQPVEWTDFSLAFVLNPFVLGIPIAGGSLPDHLVEIATHVSFDIGDGGKIGDAMALALPPLVQGCGPLGLGAGVNIFDALDNSTVEKVL